MKTLFSLLFATVFTLSFLNAQEAYVKYEIKEVTSNNEQLQMQLQMLKGSQTENFYKENKIVSKANMMGGMVKVTNSTNTTTKKVDLLLDAMGQKFWVETSVDDIQSDTKNSFSNDDVKITYDKNDKKVIQGLETFKFAISVNVNDQNSNIKNINVEGYLTDKIKVDQNSIQGFENVKLNGLPLEISITNEMMTMKMEAIELRKTVSDNEITISTDGYNKITIDQFKAMSGGGM